MAGEGQLRTYLRGHLHGSASERLITPVDELGLVGLHLADSLVVLPEGTGAVPEGATVSVMPLGRP